MIKALTEAKVAVVNLNITKEEICDILHYKCICAATDMVLQLMFSQCVLF